MILGYLIINYNNIFSELLKMKSLSIGIFLLIIFLFGVALNFRIFSLSMIKIELIFYPLIAFFLIIFLLTFLQNKKVINNLLEFTGNESYEIYLIHGIFILLVSILQEYFNLSYIYLIILIISFSLIGAYPFYLIGKGLKEEKKYHIIISLLALGLIFYSLLSYILFFLNEIVLNDFFALLSYIIILFIILFYYYYLREKIKNILKNFKFETIKNKLI